LEHRISLTVEWVARERNTPKDELSKMLIADDFAVSRTHFRRLGLRFRTHTIDRFASGANNLCKRFYSLHCGMRPGGVNAFAYD